MTEHSITNEAPAKSNGVKSDVSCWRFAAFFIKGLFTDGNEFFRMTYGWCSDIGEYNELAGKYEHDRLKRYHSEEELDKELTHLKYNAGEIKELKVGIILVNDAEGIGTRYACS